MIMHLFSMHLTMSGERLVVWTQNWVIIRDGNQSALARWKLSVEEEAHCNCSVGHINIVGLFILKQAVGVMYSTLLLSTSTVDSRSYQPWVTATSGRRRSSSKVWFSCHFHPSSYFMWLLCKFFLKMMYGYLCACMLCFWSVNKHGAALTSCRLL